LGERCVITITGRKAAVDEAHDGSAPTLGGSV
jgi:hypothetical protein